MFHAIVVDDESAALNRFERIAAGDGRISLEGKFQYAEDAIEFVRQQKVDIAFLDIEMPEMSGLELAEQLMEIDPYISVIFVTAYDKYALEAFRAHAIGYLLKPLDKDELTEQLDSLYRRLGQRTLKNANQRLTIRCFGEFSVKAAADEEPAIRWKTAKAEELFALLVNYQGRAKSKESLIDALWPELEPEKSINLFRVTCTYIRTALSERGFSDVLIRDWNGYKLNTERINCDLFRFRQLSVTSLPRGWKHLRQHRRFIAENTLTESSTNGLAGRETSSSPISKRSNSGCPKHCAYGEISEKPARRWIRCWNLMRVKKRP
jgi:two-component SAPR family response regulator